MLDRRDFTKAITAGLAAASPPVWAAKQRDLKIGHTGITWVNFGPAAPSAGSAPPPPKAARPGTRPADPAVIEATFRTLGGLGFYGLELFSWQIEGMEEHGGLARHIEQNRLPLVSAYGGPDLLNPAKRRDSIAECMNWARLLKKYGGKVVVIGPNSVPRASYNFQEHKSDILMTLNEFGKALADLGLTGCLHQHTGTCIESRDETYAIMEAVDTRYVKFGPDIGQLQKGGSDPVQVVKDFLPIVGHMHLKDYSGGEHWLGYCPLGQGKVNIPAILDMMDGRKTAGMVMVELDSSSGMPLAPEKSAAIAKAYLETQGIAFHA
jgi:inosose dehydratase